MKTKGKISIRNFAGIEQVDLDIKSINILIGPQGVGKSVIVKLIYFFKENLYDLGSRKGISFLETVENHKSNMVSVLVECLTKVHGNRDPVLK